MLCAKFLFCARRWPTSQLGSFISTALLVFFLRPGVILGRAQERSAPDIIPGPILSDRGVNESPTVERLRGLEPTDPNRYELALALIDEGSENSSSGRQQAAEAAYEEALDILLDISNRHPEFGSADFRTDTRSLLWDLTDLYRAAQRLDEAERAYNKVLTAYRELAASHPNTYRAELSLILNDSGRFYRETKRMTEAEEHLQEALAIQRELTTSEPGIFLTEVATTLTDLAQVYLDATRRADAEQTLLEALAIGRKLLEDNPTDSLAQSRIAIPLNNLAHIYIEQGRAQEAETVLLEALSVRTQQNSASRGRQLASIALIHRNLANLYLETDREEDAEKAYLQGLAILREPGRAPFSERGPRLVDILLGLSGLYLKSARFEDATPLVTEAVEVSRQLWQENPDLHGERLAWSLMQEALLIHRQDRGLACSKVEEALAISKDRDLSNRIANLLATCSSPQSP